jgi:hypothetical protein
LGGARIEVVYEPSSFIFFSLQIGICMFGLFLGECKIIK